MASSSLLIFISIFIFITLISPTHSLNCTSQKLPSNRTYKNCTDLPHLGATIHFTYNTTNRSLTVAYTAVPIHNGYVSWGINPTGGGMIGTQALIAYKMNGKIGVELYNLTSYGGITAVKSLSIETWDLSAEESNGVITIFGAVRFPEKADNVSQVWQVGPVKDGKPAMHALAAENKEAQGRLEYVTATVVGGGNSTNSTEKSGGVSLVMGGQRFGGLGFYFGFVLVLLSLVM
ncbi:auxin-induced in root cultures protein 12 [Trifolium pratense]|uniref:auxin-induced in root cultures protein 12 n=1 Tax=Trifolium pratense TaxID=57577 RepID=UPI001E6907C2|nr:auxin-induced in root cultures protein 12 [Trifolium pratense]